MKYETVIAGALIAGAILWNGHADRGYQAGAVDRCVAAIMEISVSTLPEEARARCLAGIDIR